MEKARLVVCDIDNTLVPKHKNISDRTRNAIHSLRKNGILFGLASGRGVDSLHLLEEQWNIHCDMIIGQNGAELYDDSTKKNELFYSMKTEWLKQCMEIMSPFDCNPTLGRDGIHYVRRIDENTRSSGAYMKNVKPPHVVKDDSEFWSAPAVKIGFRVKAEDMSAIEKRVAEFPSEDFIGFKTENTMFEFGNKKASKGNILELYCQNHNIDLKNVYSFGDMTNDISMLKISGVGVCMLNGSDDAKAASDRITEKTVDEDGFADFVEKYILTNL